MLPPAPHVTSDAKSNRALEMVESQSLKEIRKEHIVLVLRSTLGDVVQASRILGISVGQLRRRIKELGISLEQSEDTKK
jgi:DNA-binding NtrC family response regulator